MRKIKFLMAAVCSCFVLASCGSEKNTIKDIGQAENSSVDKEDGEADISDEEIETWSVDEELKNELKYFVSDEHFYDVEEITFSNDFSDEEAKENFRVKILGTKVYAKTSELETEYSKCVDEIKEIEEIVTNVFKRGKHKFLEIEMELTNISEKTLPFNIKESFLIWKRVPDERGKEYGLPDKSVDYAMTMYTEFWVKIGEGYLSNYCINMPPNETKKVKLLCFMKDDFEKDDIYFRLHSDIGEYDYRAKAIMAPTAETTKYLKINID